MSPGSPNILWIMADDHAAHTIGAYRSRLAPVAQTPTLDRLAAEGARFSNVFCTNAVCTPSRAVMLTGLHSHRNSVRTLADPLGTAGHQLPQPAARGHQTAVIGKWHLHSEPQGFDHYEVLPAYGTYRDPRFLDPAFDWSRFRLAQAEQLGTAVPRHVTDLITEKSLNWLKRRDCDRPFLLLCHHKAPHDDFEYQERFEHLLDGLPFLARYPALAPPGLVSADLVSNLDFAPTLLDSPAHRCPPRCRAGAWSRCCPARSRRAGATSSTTGTGCISATTTHRHTSASAPSATS